MQRRLSYIQNNVDPAKIVEYLLPFVPVDMARSIIATEIEKKNKARRR